MAMNPEYVGKVYPTTEPYEVGRAKIQEFAQAIGDDHPAYTDIEVAKGLGHPDVIAPPTFPMVISLEAERQVVYDPGLGAGNKVRFVHREQRFDYRRPIRAGDVITATVRILAIDAVAGNDVITFENTIATPDGELLCTAKSIFVMFGSDQEEGTA